jgi:DnaJ-class molecular chaperone
LGYYGKSLKYLKEVTTVKDPYSILGVGRDATDEEVKSAYRELARKYHPDNYSEDNPLKDLASEKMQEINAAYDEIQKERASRGSSQSNGGYTYTGSTTGVYGDIRRKINGRHFREAEKDLFEIADFNRTAEWHYLMSVVLMHRNRVNDAMRELEIACNMDPSNVEYQKAKEMFNNSANGYGSTYYGSSGRPVRSSTDDACNCCANLICMDCLCECMGGDLIPCL